jgi:hypothetical protein
MHLGQIVAYILIFSILAAASGTIAGVLFQLIKDRVSDSWHAWAMGAGFLGGALSTAIFSIYNLIHTGLLSAIIGALGILGALVIALALTGFVLAMWDSITDVDITEGS